MSQEEHLIAMDKIEHLTEEALEAALSSAIYPARPDQAASRSEVTV